MKPNTPSYSPAPQRPSGYAELAPPPALSSVPSSFAIDPVTLMIDECMVMSSAMRKTGRWTPTGVAAIFGATDFFAEEEPLISNLGPGSPGSTPHSRPNGAGTSANPLHSSFLQLRAILTETSDINDVDSLTFMQPFLLTIESSSTSGNVTALALNVISKLLHYNIISFRSKNLRNMLIQLTTSLTHCRFEASDQNTDDAVLLKVLRLLETIIVSPLSTLLPNAVVSEVIHTCVSLACNKRRSEVLRRAAEMAMVSMTIRIFSRVKELVPESSNGDDIPAYTDLHSGVMGSSAFLDNASSSSIDVTKTPASSHQRSVSFGAPDTSGEPAASATIGLNPVSPVKQTINEKANEQFDIQCINEFLGLLISMCSPSNQYQHMESTRVFALSLITTAVEVAGASIPIHPSLMALVADPVSKDVLSIISTTDSHALLQASLKLFCTMAVILNKNLKSQIELTFNLIFNSISPKKSSTDNKINGNKTAISSRSPASKEMIVESISFLWTRSPQFFAQLFVEFDCDFEKSDLATNFIDFLCELALPESAISTTDNVPPICLEGILSFVAGINTRARSSLGSKAVEASTHELIANKVQKNSFVKCTEIFNESPKKGISALHEQKFIHDANDPKELAAFFFQKSTRLNKKVLGEFLAKPANKEIFKEFMHLFDFGGLRVDEALRVMLKAFRIPGESQQIERTVELFAEAYVSAQTKENNVPPDDDPEREPVYPDRDAVFILSYSIIMLNTDLHNPHVKKQMDLDSYRKNLRGVYNGKDFPEWYMTSIYNSIRDREIIMPEEHHGTEKWFDDVWHNLISSQSNWARKHGIYVTDFDSATLSGFDRLLFESVVDNVVSTLIKVFKEASDDNIITKLMSSIDKCANICIIYDLQGAVSNLISMLSELTTLAHKPSLKDQSEEQQRTEIPLTQISIEKREEPVTVSELSVYFGKDFKAQLSTVVLFRLVKKPNCKISSSWNNLIKIILNLFENCLINPNLFGDFQTKLKLPPLGKVKPNFLIQKVKSLRDGGILSTFSSFLKGYSDEPAEPSDQEIESTLSTLDCVKSVNIPGIFDIVSKADKIEIQKFISILSANLPSFSKDKKRFFEAEVLFLFEAMVCFALLLNQEESTEIVIDRLSEFLDSNHLTKKGYIRLSTYFYLLVRKSNKSYETQVVKTLSHMLDFKEILASHGSSLVSPLFSLADDESSTKGIFTSEQYWGILRVLGSSKECSSEMYAFAESLIRSSPGDITSENYMLVLALLDEISSLGAIGAQYEQDKSLKQSAAEKDEVAHLVQISKNCITLTGELSALEQKVSYPLVQALAHQCFNPCREVRSHAVQVLQRTILASELSQNFTANGIFEYGLFPLLAELEKKDTIETDASAFWQTQSQCLNLVSKAFLKFHSQLSEADADAIWLKLVQNFTQINKLEPSVKEPSLEVMKNMILVLQNDFLVSSKETLWKGTWEQLDELFPELKQEVSSRT